MQLRLWALLAVGAFGFITACDAGSTPPRRDSGPGDAAIDAGTDADAGTSTPDTGPPVGCSLVPDSDGDGVPDRTEGMLDSDGDGIPNHEDPDSDNDGLNDGEEVGPDPCAPRNSDGDMQADFLDADSDNDGLSDSEEVALGTDPTEIDSDGDGVTDLGEVRGSMTDPNDPASTIDPDDFFVVLPYEGDSELRRLRFGTAIQQADVYFLIDTTASMGDALANVRTSLSSIATDISARIPDVAMGVGHYEDFPASTQECVVILCSWTGPGAPTDLPYVNDRGITSSLAEAQGALNTLELGNGADCAESGTEALYQMASAAGGSFTYPDGSITIEPGCTPGGIGCPGFRDGALPIVVFVSDAQWHQGPGGSNPYAGFTPAPATFDQAATALDAIGARFIGVNVDSGSGCTQGPTELNEMARRTGSVDGSGSPLVFAAPAGSVNTAIVDGIAAVASSTPQDVNTRTENVAGNPDDFDATQFILSITPVAAFAPDGSPVTLTTDDTTFYGVTPGTEVEFEVDFRNDVRMAPDVAEIHRATIIVVGNGVTDLDRREVYIVVPPDDAEIVLL